jgi:peptidoglycan/xylan/chitin deacetylase (PgdA/CDA1 family)
MSHTFSTIWYNPPKDFLSRLEACMNAGQESAAQQKKTIIYFRADDVGVPSENFSRLMSLFYQYRMPLCLAVVPAWLTSERWSRLKSLTGNEASLWCWHQHGWRHVNHSKEGKKYEFGPGRSVYQIESDIKNGMNRLRNIMGENFYPVFTPPWNRYDDNTVKLLRQLKYKAISGNSTNTSGNLEKITEYNVHVDLHTRKEKSPEAGWDNLFDDLSKALANGVCGIMVHHQRMNKQAFVFMEHFFQALSNKNYIKTVHFKNIESSFEIQKR